MKRKLLKGNPGLKLTSVAVFTAIAVLAILQYQWSVSSGEKIIIDMAKSYNLRMFGAIAQELGHIEIFDQKPPQIKDPGEEDLKIILEEMWSQFNNSYESKYLLSISYLNNLDPDENYTFDGQSWKKTDLQYFYLQNLMTRLDSRDFRDIHVIRDRDNPNIIYLLRPFKGDDFLIVTAFHMERFIQDVIIPAIDASYENNIVKWSKSLPDNSLLMDERSYRFSPVSTLLSYVTGNNKEYYFALPYTRIALMRMNRFIPMKSDGDEIGDMIFLTVLSETGESLYFEREMSIAVQWLTGLILLLGIGVAYGLILYQKNRLSRLRQREKEFVATITHELRTPLTVIHSAADNIQSGILTSERLMQYGDLIKDQSGRLSSMIEGILLFSRLEGKAEQSPPLNPLAFADLERDLQIFIDSIAVHKGRKISLDFGSLPESALTDRETLELVLTNLITNSVRHAYNKDEDGEIRVSGHLKLPGSLIFIVEDDGYGITKKEIKHVFEPFFRGNRSMAEQIKGSGLGLYLVNRKVKLLGGAIKAESPYMRADGRSRKGSRFILSLPYNETGKQES